MSTHSKPIKAVVSSETDFHNLLQLPPSEKVERIFHQVVIDKLAFFQIKAKGKNLLEDFNALKKTIESRGAAISGFNEKAVDVIVSDLLMLFEKKPPPFPIQTEIAVQTPTERYWSVVAPGFPFIDHPAEGTPSRLAYILKQSAMGKFLSTKAEQDFEKSIYLDSTEDGLAGNLLSIPLLDDATIVHEVGCWSGEALFNLTHLAHLHGKAVAGFVGTDIHSSTLSLAESVANLPAFRPFSMHFHIANCLYPIDLSPLGISFKKELRLAQRVVPILSPVDAKKFLKSSRSSFPNKDSTLILSYALPSGASFEKNREKTLLKNPTAREVSFSGGTTFYSPFPYPTLLPPEQQVDNPELLLNTYYTGKGFQELIQEAGYKIRHTIKVGQHSDNDRNIVALQPI
ncbi:MAG: hypothetical protein LLG04_17035 [Parachlamydia sp.]|nr:hypothetical protein [Parachlamydia sp.]